MIDQTKFAAIAALDLGRIIAKLCHVESGEGWSHARADAAAMEYRRFLYLMKAFPAEQTVPSVEVDVFWHYHILDTMQYAGDCAKVFGYFLHHDPAVGLDDASEGPERARRAQRMDDLYAATFGNAPATRAEGAYCGSAIAAASYCGSAVTAAAYCGAAVNKPAYCGAAVNKPAYCGAAVTKASYCGSAVNKPSYCGAAISTASYCGAAVTAPSYCGAATSAIA